MKRATCEELELRVSGLSLERTGLEAVIHRLGVQLEDELRKRQAAEESSSGLLAQLDKTMQLAAERGKIMSVLVRRINELEESR